MNQELESKLLVVVSSFPNREDAMIMARQLIEQNLAACVQIQDGVYSLYRWQGKIFEGSEVMLSAKTNLSHWNDICAFIKAGHPYDLPEIIAFKPEEYELQYGKWVQAEVK
jgi:periplasmic divalent cation tolerance protein